MISREQIAKLLQVPVENTTVDYKERLNWSQKAARFELLRDLACLANRSGGFIGIGVRQISGGRLERIGMAADDPLPDVTQLAALFREHFAPTVPLEILADSVDGKTVGIIAVGEFTSSPIVCRKNAGDDVRPTLRRGALYVRTDAASCEEASAEDIDRMLNRALEYRAGTLRRILLTTGERAEPAAESRSRAPSGATAAPFTHEALAVDTTLRAADLFPAEDVEPLLRLRDLEELLESARVRGGSGTFFPRFIAGADRSDVAVLRRPDGLVLSTDFGARGTEPRLVSVASMSRRGAVRIRETLWEDTHQLADGRKRLGIVTTIGFVLAALLFAYRFFGALEVTRFRIRIGLVAPIERLLWIDSNNRVPFFEAYRATSRDDLFAERELSIENVGALEKRRDVALGLSSELFDYFGFRLERNLFDGIVGGADLAYLEMDGASPKPLRDSSA